MAIDLNRTHATHPAWPGHARFHVVWQTVNVVVLSLVEIAMVLARGPYIAYRFYLAAALAASTILAFFVALMARRLYAGTLSDRGGIPPWRVQIRGRQCKIDLNVVAECAGLLSLALITLLFSAA